MAVSENTQKVLDYLKDHQGEMITHETLANAIGCTVKQVIPMVTYWATERGGNKVVRSEPVDITVTDDNGNPTTKKVRYISYVGE